MTRTAPQGRLAVLIVGESRLDIDSTALKISLALSYDNRLITDLACENFHR